MAVQVLITEEHREALRRGLARDMELGNAQAEKVLIFLTEWLNHHLPMAYMQLEQAGADAGASMNLAKQCWDEGVIFGERRALAKREVLGEDYHREKAAAEKGVAAYRKALEGWLTQRNHLNDQLSHALQTIQDLQAREEKNRKSYEKMLEEVDAMHEAQERAEDLDRLADVFVEYARHREARANRKAEEAAEAAKPKEIEGEIAG